MQTQTSPLPLPEIFVGKETINRRVTLYLQRKHPHLSQALSGSGPSREDTRSIWYSRDHVATWLKEMDLLQADGMRIYFGAYDEHEGPAPGQLCLLMVLTRPDNATHKDVIFEDEPGFKEREQAPKERSFAGISREFNYGSPCPPICAAAGAAFPQK